MPVYLQAVQFSPSNCSTPNAGYSNVKRHYFQNMQRVLKNFQSTVMNEINISAYTIGHRQAEQRKKSVLKYIIKYIN